MSLQHPWHSQLGSLEPYEGAHGTLADGLCIPFYGILTLPTQVCEQAIHETLIVSHLKEDTILGMPFLEKYQCIINLQKLVVVVTGKKSVSINSVDAWWAESRWSRTARCLEAPKLPYAAESTASGKLNWE